VLVGARVYYAGRGFTQNVDGRQAIGPQLEGAFARPDLTSNERDLARRFAYLLLFRFLHNMPVVKQRPRALPLLAPEEAVQLAPGRGELDALFEGLLSGAPLARL